jgi:hypothetical protein
MKATTTAEIYRTSLFLSFSVKHYRFNAPLNLQVRFDCAERPQGKVVILAWLHLSINVVLADSKILIFAYFIYKITLLYFMTLK